LHSFVYWRIFHFPLIAFWPAGLFSVTRNSVLSNSFLFFSCFLVSPRVCSTYFLESPLIFPVFPPPPTSHFFLPSKWVRAFPHCFHFLRSPCGNEYVARDLSNAAKTRGSLNSSLLRTSCFSNSKMRLSLRHVYIARFFFFFPPTSASFRVRLLISPGADVCLDNKPFVTYAYMSLPFSKSVLRPLDLSR